MKDFMRLIQEKLGVEAKIANMPMQDTDVYKTYADVSALEALTGYHPQTDIATGLGQFLEWFRGYEPQ
jgi:UDP-glucuronate 4-epimerase